MGKGKGNSDSIKGAFDTLVGCAQIISTVIGVIALIVAFLGLAWVITHQETAIQVVRVISGEPTATPVVIVLPTGAPLPTYTPYPTYVEIIRVPGYAENGFTFNCKIDGRYVITIDSGAYSGWPSDDHPGYNGWRTRIHIYKNRSVEWGSRADFIEPVRPDYAIGQWEKPSKNEAESAALGMNITVDLQSGDYLIFMPIDEQDSYSDNRGEVVLNIELVSSP